MNRLIRSLLAVASCMPFLALAAEQQQDVPGFIDGSHLELLARNYYRNNDYRSRDSDGREWAQGLQFQYRSGYTQGVLGFGADAYLYLAQKLDSGGGRARTRLLVSDSDGSSRDSSATAGVALKARLSSTELKYGDLRPYNPVFALADSRLMPATATGFQLLSEDIAGLSLDAGHFTAGRDFNQTGHRGDFHAGYAGVRGGDVDYLGGSHTGGPLAVTAYSSRYQDLWRQYYLNLNHDLALPNGQGLNTDFNFYRSRDDGQALAGRIDVDAWSLALAYRWGAHKITAAYQRIDGNTPFDYLVLGGRGFHDSIYLANSSLIADFNGPGERSWSLGYTLDFSAFGLPGLSFNARYIRGWGVDGQRMASDSPYNYYAADEHHWERDVDIRYVVQQGRAKDLVLFFRQGTHRISGTSDADVDHVRLIVEYPLSIF